MRGRRGNRGRRSDATTVSIPVQATSTGTVAVNAFTGWTNSSTGNIGNLTAYGVTAKYLFSNTDNTIFARTTAISFDQELTFWSPLCRVYLRLTDAGKALCLWLNNDGSWQVFYVPSVATTTSFDTGYLLASGTPSGINMSDTDGDEWVFGCSGFEVYVKWNGVEQWRGKQIFHHEPGRVGLRCSSADYGFRSVSAEHKVTGALYSSPMENLIDVRDFGLKTLTATGSMTGGSSTLTLTSNPGFAIGDSIIVVIGGESGAGQPGTRGVGGQWPTLTYANTAAREAVTSLDPYTVVGQLDDGRTYEWSGSAWGYHGLDPGWHNRIMPRSLETTITNVSGTTLTLADAAVVSTTNATVVFNNATRLEAEIGFNYEGAGIGSWVDDKTIYWSAGTWYVGQFNSIISTYGGQNNWTIRGAGRDSTTIVTPKGTTGLRLQPENKTNLVIEDIEFKSNRRGDDGWLWFYDSGTTDQPSGLLPGAINPASSTVTARRLKVTNCDLSFSTCNNSIMDDIQASWETGQRSYSAWQVQISNSTNTHGTNIVIDNAFIVPALELFGGSGCSFDGVTITNGLVATNAAEDWTITNIDITIEEDAGNDADLDWVLGNGAVVFIGTNIDPLNPSPVGEFSDFDITINYANDANYLFTGINVSGNCQDISILGSYPAKPNTRGRITLPVGWSSATAKGVYVGSGDTDSILIDGIRVTPANSGSGGEVFLYSSNSEIRNSVVDVVDTDQTETNNITNAAYDAL